MLLPVMHDIAGGVDGPATVHDLEELDVVGAFRPALRSAAVTVVRGRAGGTLPLRDGPERQR